MTRPSKALIILNGEIPGKSLLQKLMTANDIIVCADGAAKAMAAYKLEPDLIIGDLDSITTETKKSFPNAGIKKIDDQETTDGEKAFDYCIENEYFDITLVGGFGKRLDHSLYNIGLLKKHHKPGIVITCFSDTEKAMLIEESIVLNEDPGTTISLIPIFGDAKGVRMEGFLYDLKKENLHFGDYCSMSNVTQSQHPKITIASGQLLLVIPL